jgi:single-strand DNA-binding protein
MESYLKKGDKIGVSGRLVTRSYEGDDGSKRYITEIIAKDLLMLGNKKTE